jgi:hypothetical protein
MRSTQLNLAQYDTDKISNNYLEKYDPVFKPFLDKKIFLLELGVNTGGSLLLWRDYFPNGLVVGIDISLPKEFKPAERIHLYEGSQEDTKFLSRVANDICPDGFDIIIDDASHIGKLTKAAFWHLFDNHLKTNGLYVIEDWGTGYWDDWPDGKSLNLESYFQPICWFDRFRLKVARKFHSKIPMRCHSYGMVGFIKQLIDEQGAHDVTRKQLIGKSKRMSRFKSIIINPSIVFITKADIQPLID